VNVRLPPGATGWPPHQRSEELNNLKQIGLALHNYESVAEKYPPAGVYPAGATSSDMYSVQARLLPRLRDSFTAYALVDDVGRQSLAPACPKGR